ncbi:helix-turn-helix transcriptional regulator [Dyadobacter frigoris]|uniref:YafY family transcriptional regulator n=1 Tax=Dyadobacter frigoris TaxID=2576211 RepID=A0A4U6CPH0_9BACT|nr:YafY family protein [Dyadobacter frigoris]TKT85277.1 YafY family transcriptional regulator [Dyadobacter frigoris]GLU54736.1 transcriptional regulator [Dyadobacter frigoris]
MIDPEITRLSRLVALLTLLQTKRVLTATELAHRFSVSTRTIYRDIRTLESAGIPVVTQEGKGYGMLDGYRLPPVMFTREEAIALLTAEKLATQLTDITTAQLSGAAMNKLRAAMRQSDRDHLEIIAPHILVLPGQPGQSNAYQQLVTAVTAHRVVHILYRGAENDSAIHREIEPIGLYLSQQWHVVGYCRLRQAFRDFRLDRIQNLLLSEEVFAARPETLQQYWADEARRKSREKVIIRFQAVAVLPALAQHLHDTKHQYGWTHEELLPDGSLEMIFFIGSLPYLATWLLPYAGAVTILEPIELRKHLQDLAQRAYDFFVLRNLDFLLK